MSALDRLRQKLQRGEVSPADLRTIIYSDALPADVRTLAYQRLPLTGTLTDIPERLRPAWRLWVAQRRPLPLQVPPAEIRAWMVSRYGARPDCSPLHPDPDAPSRTPEPEGRLSAYLNAEYERRGMPTHPPLAPRRSGLVGRVRIAGAWVPVAVVRRALAALEALGRPFAPAPNPQEKPCPPVV